MSTDIFAIKTGDVRYPAPLAAIHDPPPTLWIRGNPDAFRAPAVAIVGSRRASPYSLEVARRLGADLARRRVTVVSGMALGVDSAASMMRYSLTALDSNKPISLRLAQFAQFKGGRLASLRVVVDTFDLVEQTLGRPIHLPKIA